MRIAPTTTTIMTLEGQSLVTPPPSQIEDQPVTAAANRQKVLHDHNVKDVLIPEGKLVYLRDVGLRGRNKIYVWSSVVYGVLRAPRDGGSVYTIAPVDDPSKARNVHRSLLKDHPGHADAAETPVARAPEDVESR